MKKTIRLTESELTEIINAAVKGIINEDYPTPPQSEIEKFEELGGSQKYEHGKYAYDGYGNFWYRGHGNPLDGIYKATEDIRSCIYDFKERFTKETIRNFDYHYFIPSGEQKKYKPDDVNSTYYYKYKPEYDKYMNAIETHVKKIEDITRLFKKQFINKNIQL